MGKKQIIYPISSVFRNASLFCRQHYGHLIEIPPEKENILPTHLQKQYHCEELELATLGPKPKVGRRGFGEYVDVINANKEKFSQYENNFCRFWIGLKPFKHGGEIVWEKSRVKLHTNITNWGENQSEAEGSDDDKCVEIRDHQEWSMVSCKKSRRFICQLDEEYRVFMNLAEELKASGLTDQWRSQCSAVLEYPL